MTDLIRKFLAHFEEERHAIVYGDFAGLGRLEIQKAQLFEMLEINKQSPDILTSFGVLAARNLRLLEAAKRGLSEAQTRLRLQHEVRNNFETYGANGERKTHRSQEPTIETKA